MSYTLDGNTLSAPKTFQRSFISISQDYSSIDGKMARDTRLIIKERYNMSWEILSLSELTNILTSVNKNTPLTFSVSAENLVIAETSVIATIKSIEYSIVGNNYYAATSLELVEVS